ncbi:Phage integrase [Nitrosococcus oceani ATCC 19707]|uniref:Phage integrase n=2 Tax=Nitrosococcus oceani TaxID=1229 RepID=Q3J8Z8_NITOC|nr:integrase family protein [Nitrosococcus oceani]ABA58698.1 Phage integrase [Nitrosococcus oceani ATCC 19707]EDZ67908.1 site-specific recombinase, phage integrase family protein [Nitrosococcus oceani AFC27]KFI18775.1 integrase [Nitrosococcus oceani C-27]GEM19210.1 integrase [Nitrosococcus oceani]
MKPAPQRTKLTKTVVDRLPAPTRGQAFYWDSALPCFGVRVSAGGVKSFVIQKRIQGREKRITLGKYGHLTLMQARKEAARLLGEIAVGRNPLAEKAQAKLRAVTLGEALEHYLTSRPLKARTIQGTRHTMGKCFSDWMKRPLTSITRDKVAARHKQLGTASKSHANLAMRYLRAVFNFAMADYTDNEGRPVIADNPVNRLSEARTWFRVERRRTVIKSHELKPWMQAVQRLENGAARDYFMLVLLTGLRRTEALNLRWQNVDLVANTLTVQDTKNHQAHTLPLSDYLTEMLAARLEDTYSEYVFSTSRGRLSNLRGPLAEVRSYAGISFSIHDLRRTFATVADSLDVPGYAVKALLNHKAANDVTAGYIVVDTERLRAPMQKITDFMLRAGGLWEGGEVVELRQYG